MKNEKNKIYHNVEQFKKCNKISLKQKKDTPYKIYKAKYFPGWAHALNKK
jgi:hypothetical protein